jgi:ribosomal protein S18 acetylase RimI-like enzyme
MSKIGIIEITSGDKVELIRSLFREYQKTFLNEVAFQHYLSLQNFDAELSSLPGSYAPPHRSLLLATYEGAPAGCVALKRLGDDTCEMKRLYVRPEYRGLKLGRMLVEAIIRQAEVIGYRRMRLDTLPSMGSAQALYRSFGFREIGPYCESPVGDAVYMELSL